MPSFDTPAPISVSSYVYAGSIRFAAGDRTDTAVEVRPRDPKKDLDVRTATQTEVTFGGGVLRITTPKANLFGRGGTVDVVVELPTGSDVELEAAGTDVLGEGRLGAVRVTTSAGDVRLNATGTLYLKASHGSSTVERVDGPAEITSSTGNVRVGIVDGPASLKNSHGSTTVGAVTGELRLSGANGAIDVARAEASVTGATTNGPVRLADVARGEVRLETSNGSVEIGIREGSAAWLDVATEHGQVRNTLASAEAPARTEDSLDVHVRTNWGNIDVFRATV